MKIFDCALLEGAQLFTTKGFYEWLVYFVTSNAVLRVSFKLFSKTFWPINSARWQFKQLEKNWSNSFLQKKLQTPRNLFKNNWQELHPRLLKGETIYNVN